MSASDREQRLIASFVGLLVDHQKDFDGFVRDVENVRYCHVPIDAQQINRCEYALTNMKVRLAMIQRCIQQGEFDETTRHAMIQIKNDWVAMKNRVDGYLAEINEIISDTTATMSPLRKSLGSALG